MVNTKYIKINGTEYPCSPTMGAMLLYKQMTGEEVTAINADDFSAQFTWLYCCVKSSCRRERIPFDQSLEEFADSISIDEAAELYDTESGSETKSGTESEMSKKNSPS